MYGTAQNDETAQHIKGKCFEGFIFPETYVGFMPLEGVNNRFSPQQEDVLKAEELLKEQIAGINKDLINQTGKCPIVHKKLSKYKRQYIGVITESGDKVVWINFIWGKDKDTLLNLDKEIIIVLDGCSYYWNVKVNLTKEKLVDLSINGSA